MAERKADANCPTCRQRVSQATKLHTKNSYKVLEETLEEERKTSKKKIEVLEDRTFVLQERLNTSDKCLKKEHEENNALRKELQEIEKESAEFKRENKRERVQAEADTEMLEEKFRQRAATKKDLEEVCANLLSSHTSLNEEFLTKISDILLDKFKDQLKQNDNRCQEDAAKCKFYRNEGSKLQAKLISAETKYKELNSEIDYQKQYMEHYRRIQTEHALMTQRIAELEEELQKHQNAVKKSHSIPQPDVHEDLHMEYEKIVTKFEVLKQVEGNFKDSFDAKGFLSDIFMDAYDKCKIRLKDIIWQNIDELFKVQTHEDSNDDMEGLSHAFGLLLQYSGIKLQLTTSVAVSDVKRTVKENVPQLMRYKKATIDPVNLIEELPLDMFVKLAWKFVTQAYPVIVTMPAMLVFNEDMHKSSYHHWDKEKKDEHPLIYAQPIVYRSYHGEVVIKGLVGNF